MMWRCGSRFRLGMFVTCSLVFALWLALAVPFFFRIIDETDASTGDIISSLWKAMFVAAYYMLLVLVLAWWLTVPALALPPCIGYLLDKRKAKEDQLATS